MYAVPARSPWAQRLHQANKHPADAIHCIRCRRGGSRRSAWTPPRATSTIAPTSTDDLVIDDESQVYSEFGQPGDFVANGIGHEYQINGRKEYPYQGPSSLNTQHNGMFGGGRYLVQNKGLVLYACDNPLPAMAAANATEKAIILAIAMQESQFMDSYDSSKNNQGLAANKSCLNVCVDMLERANRDWGSAAAGSTENELRAVVGCLLKWFRGQASPSQDGALKSTLNFLRGGSTSFDFHGAIHDSSIEVNTSDYINAIASIYRELRWPSRTWDDGMNQKEDKNRTGTEYWESKNLWANNIRINIVIPGI